MIMDNVNLSLSNVDQCTFTLSIRILSIGGIVMFIRVLLYCYYDKYILIGKCLLTYEHLGKICLNKCNLFYYFIKVIT